MPRGYLNDTTYRLSDTRNYIKDLMKDKKKTQQNMADVLGISQGRFSQKLKAMTFSARELIVLFTELDADAEKVVTVGDVVDYIKDNI